MSKFTIKVELQGLKIEVEGTKEDAPKLPTPINNYVETDVLPHAEKRLR